MKKGKEHIGKAWNKYGLIVVGNIVFFALLYFFSYRPHNEENRASEFLSLAQSAETNGKYETADSIYKKVIKDYADTRAAQTATGRLENLQEKLINKTKPEQKKQCEKPDLGQMLLKGPAQYLATYLASKYDEQPKNQEKLRTLIWKYIKIAVIDEGADIVKIKQTPVFSKLESSQEFFSLKPHCSFQSDWIFDDFSIKNDNFFAWNEGWIKLTVQQNSNTSAKEMRFSQLKPGQSLEIMEFRVSKKGGPITCKIEIQTREGQVQLSQKL